MEILYYVPFLLLIPAAIQIFYYLFFFSRFAFTKPESKPRGPQPPVSVIVCGRNEEENFEKNLPSLFAQEYPIFEVVAINDQSIDGSKDVLEHIQKQHSNMRIVDVQENDRFWRGKKYGLTLGIKAAQYDHLLFIDADCEPASKHWIAEMASGYGNPNNEMVLGFGGYQKKRSLLNWLIRYETLHTAIQYFSYALMGMPYMGVGRNLSYLRPLFYKHKGFVPHMHIPMGDDDLFVNIAATSKNTAVVYTKDSFTKSIPEVYFKDWFEQKRRHLAASTRYKGSHQFLLGTYGATQILFYFSLLLTPIFWPMPLWFWYAIGAKVVLQYFIVGFASRKTGDWEVLFLLPFLEFFLIVNQILILLANSTNKGYKWK